MPILKQIDKQNDDGSYSYGYEAADGTFKIETKYPDGEVYGKYGYVDDTGKLRTVEYGASRRGFEPSGNEIQVPPPTLRVKSQYEQARPLGTNEEDDGQYREDPGAYYKNEPNSQARRYNTNTQPQSFYINNNDPIQDDYFNALPQQNNYYEPQPQPYYNRPQPAYRPQPQPAYRPQPQPAYRPQPSYNNYAPRNNYNYNPAPPAFPNYNQFNGHPATNVDLASGSYSVNYRR